MIREPSTTPIEEGLAMLQRDVIIGSLVVRKTALVLDKFLKNQKEIQENYPQSDLIIATDEPDFKDELIENLKKIGLRGDIIVYETVKPFNAKSRIWSIICGRNAIREYVLRSPDARYLLFIDADMTCDPLVVVKMKKQVGNGYDLVHSGYLLRHFGICLIGLGCSIIAREILDTVPFRCIEFENNRIIDEGTLFELDLVKLQGKIKKGLFLKITHYINAEESLSLEPGNLNLFQMITSQPLLRYMLTQVSIVMHRDIGSELQRFIYNIVNL